MGKKGRKKAEKMEKIVDFILEKMKEGYCLILGEDYMIDHFVDSFKIEVSLMMMDFKEYGDVKTGTLRLFNNRTKEIATVGMVKKIDLLYILKMGAEVKGVKIDNFEHVIGVELVREERRKGIYPIIAETDDDKKNIIDKFFKMPEGEEIKIVEEIIRKEKMKSDEEFIGYA